jgi:ectoine hydroxylase-related dioxygenase (phytanoyl-CoA dioxygenase family)
MASEAWLGPGYQVTGQGMRVTPGGQAQAPHRHYPLGFMSRDAAARWPAHVHAFAPSLTLQGIVSHAPSDAGAVPIQILPFSQLAPDGYITVQREDYRAVFEAMKLEVVLGIGDALFFNPALMSAVGGAQDHDPGCLFNVFIVASAFGRAIETLDRGAMCRAVFGALKGLTGQAQAYAIAACADGYPFPTNLDSNPPLDGLSPQSQADVLRQAIQEDWDGAALDQALVELEAKNRA